ncbi:hypothetical protein LDENG_00154010 [Lucifuga dentata]|nr:hypothetical protein LDENG_00154010 [Lucifuga dentata]
MAYPKVKAYYSEFMIKGVIYFVPIDRNVLNFQQNGLASSLEILRFNTDNKIPPKNLNSECLIVVNTFSHLSGLCLSIVTAYVVCN